MIFAENLSKQFEDLTAVDHIHLDVGPARFWCCLDQMAPEKRPPCVADVSLTAYFRFSQVAGMM
jgi:hypothetical protein